MLCPKCKTEGMVKRDKKTIIWVCRNRGCANYNKPIRANNDSKRA